MTVHTRLSEFELGIRTAQSVIRHIGTWMSFVAVAAFTQDFGLCKLFSPCRGAPVFDVIVEVEFENLRLGISMIEFHQEWFNTFTLGTNRPFPLDEQEEFVCEAFTLPCIQLSPLRFQMLTIPEFASPN
jgi:hypothetical protein